MAVVLARVGLVCLSVVMIAGTDAMAQGIVPTAIMNTLANSGAGAKTCDTDNAPPSAEYQKQVAGKVQQLVDSYFVAASQGNQKKLRDLFTSRGNKPRWTGLAGELPIDAIDDSFAKSNPGATSEREILIVAGDFTSVRGIWTLPLAKPGQTTPAIIRYAVDFRVNTFWGGWSIWHMHLYADSASPPTPVQYCHFDPDKTSY